MPGTPAGPSSCGRGSSAGWPPVNRLQPDGVSFVVARITLSRRLRMRLALVAVLLLTAVTLPPAVVEAGSRRVEHVVPDRAFSGPGWRFNEVENFRQQFRQDQRRFHRAGDQPVLVVPPVVVVSPGRCWQAGYWDYPWVPH